MSHRIQDEYTIWGMTQQGVRTPTVKGYASSWDQVRKKYISDYPMAIYLRMEASLPDLNMLSQEKASG